jgi:hypothetical protein
MSGYEVFETRWQLFAAEKRKRIKLGPKPGIHFIGHVKLIKFLLPNDNDFKKRIKLFRVYWTTSVTICSETFLLLKFFVN